MATYKRKTTVPANGSNVPGDVVAAYQAQVTGALDAIRLDTNAIETALSGADGFNVVVSKNVAARPSLEVLTRWDQDGKIDPVLNQIIMQTHDASGAEYRPSIVSAYRKAKFLAVHAASEDVVNRCRFKVDEKGNPIVERVVIKDGKKSVVGGDRARGNVPAQDYKSDAALLNIADAAEAQKLINAEREAAAKALKALGPKPTEAAPLADRNAWRDAERIATMWNRTEPTVESICWLADVENSAKQGVSLFRRRLLVDFGKDRFEEYKGKVTTKPIYNILDPALGKLLSAQKAWYADQFKPLEKETDEAKKAAAKKAIIADLPLRGEAMRAAMREELDKYLSPFEKAQAKAAAKPLAEALSAKLWRAAKAAEKYFEIPGEVIQEGLMRITAKWREDGLIKPKMTDDEKARIDNLATLLDSRADTRAAASDMAKANGEDAAKRQAELDKAAADAASAKANAPTPKSEPAPAPVTGAAVGEALRRPRKAKALPA